ncbi:GNAT family N-acetyltransferase [Rugosimonospora africana]|uniref:GCN5 family N-acetyltransferase n=1 Tax=Rugosimonospora africana TaxID=556532 RepID=A0A8J3QNM3_9ACTN|nr:GNAT family N-acetyltransferase [Rugosimonospora africana]GIH14475.1 GCN5 family N-acetyltransferase [Rugosimonospora africana]
MSDPDGIDIRPGGEDDVPRVLALLDGATRWLVARGRTGQWGTEPHSTNPRRIAQVTGMAHGGGLYLAWSGTAPVGALAVGQAPDWIPPADEPEVYVNLLVTDRSYEGRGIGGRLLGYARQLAEQRNVGLVRVDCYGGDDRALVRYYESQGFTATDSFTVPQPSGPWPGQVLARRV